MTLIAGLTHIDVPPCQSQCVVGFDSGRRFDAVRPDKQRQNFRQATEGDQDGNEHAEQHCILLDQFHGSGFLFHDLCACG